MPLFLLEALAEGSPVATDLPGCRETSSRTRLLRAAGDAARFAARHRSLLRDERRCRAIARSRRPRQPGRSVATAGPPRRAPRAQERHRLAPDASTARCDPPERPHSPPRVRTRRGRAGLAASAPLVHERPLADEEEPRAERRIDESAARMYVSGSFVRETRGPSARRARRARRRSFAAPAGRRGTGSGGRRALAVPRPLAQREGRLGFAHAVEDARSRRGASKLDVPPRLVARLVEVAEVEALGRVDDGIAAREARDRACFAACA